MKFGALVIMFVFVYKGYSENVAELKNATLCPETVKEKPDILIYLYTNTISSGMQLFGRLFSTFGPALENCKNFNIDKPTRIIIHGWHSSRSSPFVTTVKDAYLQKGEFNIVVVDWNFISSGDYFKALKYIEDVGVVVGNILIYLKKSCNISLKNIVIVGHSLGAQIAAKAGRYVANSEVNEKVDTIFALDPAGPEFLLRSNISIIEPTDADYVESIHTDIGNFGTDKPTGTASFFPNFGDCQPQCNIKFIDTKGCAHSAAWKYFAESINSEIGFHGIRCQNLSEVVSQQTCNCYENDCSNRGIMGGDPPTHKRGIYYLKTRQTEPYAMGSAIRSRSAWKKVQKMQVDQECRDRRLGAKMLLDYIKARR